MNAKVWIITGMTLGSIIGGYIPSLWGDYSLFSFSSILGNLAGGALGIWIGFKVSEMF